MFLTLAAFATWTQAAEIKGVRAWVQPTATRVVFDLSAAADYRVFTMRNPDRAVIDFSACAARAPLRLPAAGRSRIRGLRSAARGDDGLRIVLDLNGVTGVDAVLLAPDSTYGHRLQLDLAHAGHGRPALGQLALHASRPTAATTTSNTRTAQPPASAASAPRAVPTPAPAPAEPALQPVGYAPPPPAAAPARALRDVVIAIDAGHGGADVGAIGPSGSYEKDIVLAVARELAATVNRQPGMRAVLTRDGDYFLKLRTRMDKARAAQADLFISIHADAFRDRRVRGSSVFVLSQRGASSEAAKWLADNENAADLIGGVSLDDKDQVLKSVLLDLSQTASIEASIDVGTHVLNALKRLGPVHKKRVEHAGFMVLKSPDIPSILVETAFISNPTEEKRLRSESYRRQLATAILQGVASYFELSAPADTRLAEARRHRVTPGETLSGIAYRYDVSIDSLKLANSIDGELVRSGAVLRIP